MHCQNCGEKLNNGSKFCETCGQKVDFNSNKNLKSRSALKNKAWFRFLKVVYILMFSFFIIVFFVFSFVAIPKEKVDQELSTIKCDNGKSYYLEENNISIYTFNDELSSYSDEKAKILCKYNTLNYFKYSSNNISKNYEFYPVYIKPNYGEWLGYSFLSLMGILIFFKLIKITFFYIVIGEKPQWKSEFKLY